MKSAVDNAVINRDTYLIWLLFHELDNVETTTEENERNDANLRVPSSRYRPKRSTMAQ